MEKALEDGALNQIFREARTHCAWLDKPVIDETLRQLYDLMKWGPTSANGSPVRLVFLRDIGPGTYTVMPMITAEHLGLKMTR